MTNGITGREVCLSAYIKVLHQDHPARRQYFNIMRLFRQLTEQYGNPKAGSLTQTMMELMDAVEKAEGV